MTQNHAALPVAAAILICVVLVCARIASAPPTSDEALVAVPAWNLAHHGFPGTTMLAAVNMPWKGIHRRTYNTLPSGILYLASCFAVLPATILATRIAFALWGPVLLLSCFVFLKRLIGNQESAVLGTILLGLNYSFVLETSQARVDLMTAALGMAALASYCEIRLRSLKAAVLISATLAVFACLTHPQGLLYVSGLIILAAYLDRRSLSPVHFSLAAIPFACCGALWLWYVAQDPGSALSQLQVNINGQGRFASSLNPLRAVRREFMERYLTSEGISTSHTWMLKLVMLLIPFGSAVGILLTRPLRRQRPLRVVLLLTAGVLILQTLFENSKFHVYLIHIEIFYCALVAAFALYGWRAGPWQRMVTALVLATYILINLGGIAWRVRVDFITPGFRSALAFLQRRISPQDLVMGDGALWFDCCGPGHNLVADPDLGVRSGLLADYIVDPIQQAPWKKYRQEDPALFNAIQAHLDQFDLIYDYEDFRIYHRRRQAAPGVAISR